MQVKVRESIDKAANERHFRICTSINYLQMFKISKAYSALVDDQRKGKKSLLNKVGCISLMLEMTSFLKAVSANT